MTALTAEEAQALVLRHGSVDEAARNSPMSVGAFRRFCRENGIAAIQRLASSADGVTSEAMLRQEVTELRRQVARLSKTAVRDERILEVVRETTTALKPRYAPRPKRKASKQTAQEGVLLWGDVHAAESITLDETGGLNAYSWDEMLARHDRILESLFSFRDHQTFPISHLHIAGLGDFLSGEIHDLAETNEKPMVEATLQFGVDAARWIERMVPEFESITLTGVSGNHPRTSLKPKTKNVAVTNFDWLALEIIAMQLAKYPSVHVTVPKSPYTTMDVLGTRFFLFHGDGVSSSALVRRVRELEKTFASLSPIHVWLCGHFHVAQMLEQGKIFVNGSVVGPNGFSLKTFGGGAPAQQTLLLVHPTRRITEVLPLDLQRGGS